MTGPEGRDPTPLDWASYYVENLKFGPISPGAGQVVTGDRRNVEEMFARLFADANVTSMTPAEFVAATEYYIKSIASAVNLPPLYVRSIYIDAVMHGIAFAAGLRGGLRDPKGE